MPLIEPELMSEIISTAADISLLVTFEGRVSAVMPNPHHPSFGQLNGWVGRHVSEIITDESYEKLAKRLVAIKRPGAGSLAVELNHTDHEIWEFPVRYSMHNVGDDGSILLLGRDMRPIAEMQQQLVLAQIARLPVLGFMT